MTPSGVTGIGHAVPTATRNLTGLVARPRGEGNDVVIGPLLGDFWKEV